MFLSVLLAASAFAGTWSLDPAHSKVGFRVSHMMVSSVEGEFPDVSAKLDLEPGKVADLSVQVEVEMKTVDTNEPKRDAHLRSAEFLDVEKFPTMRFVSKKVKPNKDGGFDVFGELTLHGVTKAVTLEAKGLQQAVTDPWGNKRVGVHATATIDRQEFGVAFSQTLDGGGVLVGDEIELRIDAEFTLDPS